MPLTVDSLTVRRGERTIISALSFVAPTGSAVLLTGPNGAGKTTLLRALAGFLGPVEGSIRFAPSAGEPVDAIATECHYVGHLNGIKPTLTAYENALFWARYLGGPSASSAILAALDQFRLADLGSIRAGYMSAGQTRRLGLARLLLAPRPIWLLDEPAVSLDAASQTLLAAAVNRHLAAGGIAVAATHQPLGFEPARELALAPVRSH